MGVSDEDEAFSFPVTPPSEPAAPGAVFSSWASFQSGGRAHKVGRFALLARGCRDWRCCAYNQVSSKSLDMTAMQQQLHGLYFTGRGDVVG